jgi:hypothetical protein
VLEAHITKRQDQYRGYALARVFFVSSSFFAAGFGGGAPPLELKKLRMSGMAAIWKELTEEGDWFAKKNLAVRQWRLHATGIL